MDNLFIRLAVICLLAYLGFEAFKELKRPDKDEYVAQLQMNMRAQDPTIEVTDADIPKDAKIKNPVKLLTLFVILAAGVGFVSVKWVIPMIGDAVSGATFSSGEQQEASPYAKAHALVTQGRYDDALAMFQQLAGEHPQDRTPVMEMVKLQLGRLQNPDGAISTLHHALEREWPEEDATFFMLRLAALYADEKGDTAGAKEMLSRVISTYPGTPAAGSATHQLRDIEEAEFLASRGGI